MPSAREIKRRIRGVRNTAQIAKAMETVAASKMRRAQSQTLGSRPYAENEPWRCCNSLARMAPGQAADAAPAADAPAHPPDRGDPDHRRPRPGGAFNTNMIRQRSGVHAQAGTAGQLCHGGPQGPRLPACATASTWRRVHRYPRPARRAGYPADRPRCHRRLP